MGSDVPFALLGGTAIGQGRGELLTAALTTGTYHWVLAFSSGALSTPEVYAACDRLRAAGRPGARYATPPPDPATQGTPADAAEAEVGPPTLSTELMAALRSGDPAARRPAAQQRPAARGGIAAPGLRRTLAAGKEFGALGAIVSGSGPTCAFLAADAGRARELAVATDRCRGLPRRGQGQGPSGWRRGDRRGTRMSPAHPLVTLEAATKAYGPRVLLDQVSLGVAAGDRIGVVGRNGAGKSTLLEVLAGRGGLDSGRATRARDLDLGYLPQAEELTGTVRELVFGSTPRA